jgi:hypothetical protein
MRRHVFLRIVDAVQRVDPYFIQRPDCTGLMGISALQKCIAAIRILAYGLPANAVDEYVRIGPSTAQEALKHFCRAVIDAFGGYYLRAPTEEDVRRLVEEGEQRGFPGMLGSIDCMHWTWRNCPSSWKGMFTGRGKSPSMILEAVASRNLWIWHAYFGMPGSCNDINVLHRSSLFDRFMQGTSTPVNFTVNGHSYNMGYYLADGIYPDWPAFVKTVRHPMEMKTRLFAAKQEGARKDVERAFGVLQARWAVIRGPAYPWDRDDVRDMMTACIIMHNMIIEDEGDSATNTSFENPGQHVDLSTGNLVDRHAFVQAHHRLRDRDVHFRLQSDLIVHNWNLHGSMVTSATDVPHV